MNVVKKFEKYTIDMEEDMSTEYVKLIISTYLDKGDESTLESVYADIIKGDELDENIAYIIKNELQDYLFELYTDSENIRTIVEIDANKYNI